MVASNSRSFRRQFLLASIAPALLVTACNSDSGSLKVPAPTPTPAASPSQAANFAAKCEGLQSNTVAAGNITLPTSGAFIGNAVLVAASASAPEYCQVNAVIQPVDKTAPPITIQVNLPASWNQKAVHFGGGGFDGSLVKATGSISGGATVTTPIQTPLQRGYATFGSDGGHVDPTLSDASFAANPEALQNFAGDQLRKTLDTAQFLMKAVYGAIPKKQYVVGGSNGGREAFMAVQRWPEKYDGVIASYPAAFITGQSFSGTENNKLVYGTPGAWMNPAKVGLVNSAVKSACDLLDGAADGIVSNITACTATFRPETLRCADGTDTGNGCLSDVQIRVLKSVTSRRTIPFAMRNGLNSYPGFGIWGFNGAFSTYTATGTANPGGTGFLRYMITKDSTTDQLTHIPENYAAQWVSLSNKLDATATDLTAFRNRGGKVLWLHGFDDSIVPFQASIDYFDRLTIAYGATNLASFLRFYSVPGFDHGFGAFNPSLDILTALENWVENGAAPAKNGMVMADANAATKGRSRPLCEWPDFPKYKGSGDVNVAANYTCAAS